MSVKNAEGASDKRPNYYNAEASTRERKWYFSHYGNFPYQNKTSDATGEGRERRPGPSGTRKGPRKDECHQHEVRKLTETLAASKYAKGTKQVCASSLIPSCPGLGLWAWTW